MTALIQAAEAVDSDNKIVTTKTVFIQHLPDLQFRNAGVSPRLRQVLPQRPTSAERPYRLPFV
jgi:hypothetical protein